MPVRCAVLPPVAVPYREPLFALVAQSPEVDLRVPSIDKAATMLGFQPTVSLEAGITRTIPWYAEHMERLLAVGAQ